MAEAAAKDPPTHGSIAAWIVRTRRENPEKEDPDVDLSAVWTNGVRVRSLAWRVGLRGTEIPLPEPSNPEDLLAELTSLGFNITTDMGSIGTLEELRASLGGAKTQDIHANAASRRWCLKNVRDSHLINSPGQHTTRSNQLVITPQNTAGTEGTDAGQVRTNAEWNLMMQTVPELPGTLQSMIITPNRTAAVIAFLNHTTPHAVEQYLDEGREEPGNSRPEPCPYANTCPSWCGHLQASGEFPFALTHDGKHESCQYQQFLVRYGAMDVQQREPLAQAELKQRLRQTQAAPEKVPETISKDTPEDTGQAALF